VVPGLLIGRRLLPGELPSQIGTVLDLTSEFIEPKGIREACRYVGLPILDASTLPVADVVPVLRELAGLSVPLYVHCAQGHGRTGMIAAALLLARRQASNVPAALELVRRARPGVRLSRAQADALAALAVALD
jgi:protein-tyrosine phosphatase